MGVFNPNIRSMTPIFDAVYQAGAAANHSVLYTVTDFSGKGICSNVGIYLAKDAGTGHYIQLTVDGAAPGIMDVNAVQSTNVVLMAASVGVAGFVITIPLVLEFDTSIKFEMGNDESSTYNLTGVLVYHSFSEEYQRTLHPAGSQIPDAHGGNRPDVMTIDVMLVWYKSKDGSISNRMIVTQNKMPLIDENAITGIIQKTQFETTLNGPLWTKVTDNRNVQIDLIFKDKIYQANFVNGILDAGSFQPKVKLKL